MLCMFVDSNVDGSLTDQLNEVLTLGFTESAESIIDNKPWFLLDN